MGRSEATRSDVAQWIAVRPSSGRSSPAPMYRPMSEHICSITSLDTWTERGIDVAIRTIAKRLFLILMFATLLTRDLRNCQLHAQLSPGTGAPRPATVVEWDTDHRAGVPDRDSGAPQTDTYLRSSMLLKHAPRRPWMTFSLVALIAGTWALSV